MSTKALQIIPNGKLNGQECAALDKCIDVFIDGQQDNSLAVNQLAFDCVNGIMSKDSSLEKNSYFKTIWQNILGDSDVQVKVSSDLSSEQYFYQQILNKLADRNLLSFDLITAINNRLNSSLVIVDREFGKIQEGLGKFFKQNRNELARMEARLENVEKKVTLLNWQNSIEYQEFNGDEYCDLGNAEKIVCLVRDFYDITGGNWSTSDLLLLKTAMSTIDILPKDKLNYFQAIAAIADSDELKEKLLGGKVLRDITKPAYLIPMSGIKKLDSLQNSEKYIVNSVSSILKENRVNKAEDEISRNLAMKYLAAEAFVDTDNDVEAYDLLLDLLYNLRQVEIEGILVEENQLLFPVVQNNLLVEVKPKNSFDIEICEDNVDELLELADELEEAEDYEQLVELYQQMADADIDEGYLGLGYAYYDGTGVEQSYAKAKKNFTKAKELDNGEAWYMLGKMMDEGNGFNVDPQEAFSYFQESAKLDFAYAYYQLGNCYYSGRGVGKNLKRAVENFEIAMKFDIAEAYREMGDMAFEGELTLVKYGYKQPDYSESFRYFKKAEALGLEEALFNRIGWMYDKGEGTSQDYIQALKYYKLAGENGNEAGYWNIHLLYKNGRGVPQNYAKAGEYLIKAAQMGDSGSVKELLNNYKQYYLKENDILEFR